MGFTRFQWGLTFALPPGGDHRGIGLKGALRRRSAGTPQVRGVVPGRLQRSQGSGRTVLMSSRRGWGLVLPGPRGQTLRSVRDCPWGCGGGGWRAEEVIGGTAAALLARSGSGSSWSSNQNRMGWRLTISPD